MEKTKKKPPFIAQWMLYHAFEISDRDVFIGDFEEFYNEKLHAKGAIRAYFWYWAQVFRSLPKILSNIYYWRISMFKNYLKIAYRNIVRHKSYSLINIGGLTAGIGVGILILLYVTSVLTFDSFHENADDIYMVYKYRLTPSGEQRTLDTWVPLKDKLVSEYPLVETGSRVWTNGPLWVQYEDKKFQDNLTYVDPAFLEMFSFPLIQGDKTSALEKNSVVIGKGVAERYFGDENPIGKVLNIGFTTDYTVSGVFEDIPTNSFLTFTMLASFENAMDISFVPTAQWRSSFLFTFIQLKEGTKPETLQSQFPELITNIWDAETEGRTRFEMTVLPEINNLTSNGSANRYAYILLMVAIAIIVIAAINFTNLSTSRSMNRAKEIGMRKVLGANKTMLANQFLGESLLMTFVALLLGVVFAEALLPVFNQLVGMQLAIDYGSASTVFGILGLGMAIGLIAGGYPALFLSRFLPVDSLKGDFRNSSSGVTLRNVLVLAQFAISIVLITGTLVVWNQIDYMKHRDLNFDKENVIVVPVRISDFQDRAQTIQRLRTLKDELRRSPGILSVSATASIPGNYAGSFTFARPEGWDSDSPMRVRVAIIDEHYFETMGIEFLEGRNFDPEIASNRGRAVIINEAALNEIGWDTAQDKTIARGRNQMPVLGVVKDFNYQSLQNPVRPVLHVYLGGESGNHRFIAVKVGKDNVASTIDLMREKWRELDPTADFNFYFLDENLDTLYQNEENISRIVQYCSLIGIIVASLGLLGLASFTVMQRKKEIGIRKVVGATTTSVIMLLSKQFAKPVIVANLIAWPVAYQLMSMWLENYAYRVSMGISVFFISGISALLVAMLIVSFQSARAALAKTVDTLRNE